MPGGRGAGRDALRAGALPVRGAAARGRVRRLPRLHGGLHAAHVCRVPGAAVRFEFVMWAMWVLGCGTGARLSVFRAVTGVKEPVMAVLPLFALVAGLSRGIKGDGRRKLECRG